MNPAPLEDQAWYVYLLECVDGTYYAGITKDLRARLSAHTSGRGAAYTRSHPPRQMLAARGYPHQGAALRAEHALKRLRRADKLAFFEFNELDPLGCAAAEVECESSAVQRC